MHVAAREGSDRREQLGDGVSRLGDGAAPVAIQSERKRHGAGQLALGLGSAVRTGEAVADDRLLRLRFLGQVGVGNRLAGDFG